jgi:hypothetical protein
LVGDEPAGCEKDKMPPKAKIKRAQAIFMGRILEEMACFEQDRFLREAQVVENRVVCKVAAINVWRMRMQ